MRLEPPVTSPLEVSPEVGPIDLSKVQVEIDTSPIEWAFKGLPHQIGRTVRVRYYWTRGQYWITDYLLVGYGGTFTEREHRESTTKPSRYIASLFDNRSMSILLLLGIVLIIGLALIGSNLISSVLSRADAADEAQVGMYSLLTSLRGFSIRLTAAADDLVDEIGALGQEIAAVRDEALKQTLDRWFTPMSKTVDRVHNVSSDMDQAFSQVERVGTSDQEYGDQYASQNFNLIGQAFAQKSRTHSPSRSVVTPSTTPELLKMYEETAQKRDKINFIQHGFYVLGGFGCFLLLLLIFVPQPTKQTVAEIAKMYVPTLISSWGTFIAAISI